MPTSPSLSEQIFQHAMRHAAPFASEPGHAWAAIPTSAMTHEACSVASDRFREWLGHSFQREHGVFPSHHSMRHAVRILQAHARFGDHPRQEVFTRIGCTGDPMSPSSIGIDLANPAREIVEITAAGWRITPTSGHRFLTRPAARPLPPPSDSRLPTPDSLASILPNLPTPTLNRLAVWLFSALRPTGPYPVLILSGPPSSGKTTTAIVLRNLLDPATNPLHTLPSTEHELFHLCLHNRVLAFDHVPRLTRDVSIAVARAAAGTAFAHHGQHPLDYSLNYAIERPVIVTVPYADSQATDWARNTTIANLAITVHLDAIPADRMRPRPQILHDLDAATPHIMAGLCNAAAAAIANTSATGAAPPSRSADIHHWIASAAPALGLTIENVNSALSADPLIRAITTLLQDTGSWTGTATELPRHPPSQSRPRSPRNLEGSVPTSPQNAARHLRNPPDPRHRPRQPHLETPRDASRFRCVARP
jgi:putative DNA primase/helicase